MLCAAASDPFQGDNYRIAAVIHESILCPILNKVTVLIFSTPQSIQHYTTTMTSTTTTNCKQSLDELSYQQHSKLTTPPPHQPIISELSYYPEDATTQLIHRNKVRSNSLDYQRQQHHHHQHQQHQHHHHEEQQKQEAVFQGGYILDQDDIDAKKPTTITAEYTMPTTKID